MSKSIARGHKKALVDQCFSDDEVHDYIMRKIRRILHAEMKEMCSFRVGSILQNTTYEALKNFKWNTLILEMEEHSPNLLYILRACTPTTKEQQNSVVGMCSALLLKSRFRRMCLAQKIISIILHAGHSGKQVFLGHLLMHTSPLK